MRGIYLACGHLFAYLVDSDFFFSCPGILVCAGKRFEGLLACTPTKRSKKLEIERRLEVEDPSAPTINTNGVCTVTSLQHPGY